MQVQGYRELSGLPAGLTATVDVIPGGLGGFLPGSSPGLHWPLRPPPAPHQGKVTSSGQLASYPPVSMPAPPDFGLGPDWPGPAWPALPLAWSCWVSTAGKGEHGPASLHRREQGLAAQLSSISRLVSPHSSSAHWGDAILLGSPTRPGETSPPHKPDNARMPKQSQHCI